MMRKESPMEWALVVQAVAVASFGPLAPKRRETCPAARWTRAAEMKKGEILRGPPSMSAVCSRSITSNPPMPEPICTPTFSAFSGVTLSCDIFIASSAAAIAKWMKRPIFFTSFFSMNWKGSKLRTSPAIWQAKADASNWVMRSIPLLPASRACHTESVVLPTEQIRPMPVITTRLSRLLAKLLACLRVFADVVDGIRHGANLLRILVGDFDIEGLFEGHHELDSIERIGAQVIHERRAGRDLALVHAELLDNNLFHFFINGCHVFLVSSLGIAGPGSGPAFTDLRLRVGHRIVYGSNEVETSSLKGIGKVCKGRNQECLAPKGASDFEGLPVSLKRYPDTKPEFFNSLLKKADCIKITIKS